MSKNQKAVQCRCANAIYSGGYAKSDSDPDTRESTAEVQDVDAKKSLTDSIRIGSSVISGSSSQKSIAVEVLKKTDSDRLSKIGMQNLKLSLLFPEASLRPLIIMQFLFSFSHIEIYAQMLENIRKFTSGHRCSGGATLNRLNNYQLALRSR